MLVACTDDGAASGASAVLTELGLSERAPGLSALAGVPGASGVPDTVRFSAGAGAAGLAVGGGGSGGHCFIRLKYGPTNLHQGRRCVV